MQLIEMHSFSSWTSWELYGSPSRLVVAKGRLDLDAEKFRDPVVRLRYPLVPEPTVEVSCIEISDDFIAATIAQLNSLNVPAHPGPTHAALDGTGYLLRIEGPQTNAEYQWRSTVTEAWEPLMDWASRWIADHS